MILDSEQYKDRDTVSYLFPDCHHYSSSSTQPYNSVQMTYPLSRCTRLSLWPLQARESLWASLPRWTIGPTRTLVPLLSRHSRVPRITNSTLCEQRSGMDKMNCKVCCA